MPWRYSTTWSGDQEKYWPADCLKTRWLLVVAQAILFYPKVGMVFTLEKYNCQHVLIADREPKVRSALKLFFESSAECPTVGEAAHTQEVLKYVCRHGPGLLILDWDLPGQALDYFIFVIRMIYPDLLIVALGLCGNDRDQAMAAGANAFINKLDFPEQIVETVDDLWLSEPEPIWESFASIDA